MRPPWTRWTIAFGASCAAGCGHSDSYVITSPVVGPFNQGTDVPVAFNPDQDYWPMWTQDGRGILYAFVDAESAVPPKHRCLGLLPAAGGTRIWQLCDNRAIRVDTLSSYAAFALDSAGRLLLAEAIAPFNSANSESPRVILWLTDTAAPYVRQALLTLPQTIGTTPVTWLSDLAWIDSTDFVVLGQQFSTIPHCVTDVDVYDPLRRLATQCETRDTVLVDSGGVVLRGAISGGHAVLTGVVGTEHATGYSFANGRASIVFTIKHDLRLYVVPAAGGAPAATAPIDATHSGVGELMGVACRGSTCLVAKDAVYSAGELHAQFLDAPYALPGTPPGPMELHRVSLVDGSDQVLLTGGDNVVFASPQLSPASNDLVVQQGGGWGHLQTFATSGVGPYTGHLFVKDGNSALHVYHGLLP